jgi:hypothetical protein
MSIPLILLSVFCVGYSGIAKETPKGGGPKISQVDGYTIKIVRLQGGTYGYEIRKGAEVLVRQRRNPFTGSELGFKDREDALKTASWLVKTAFQREKLQPFSRRLTETPGVNRLIPKSVANQLGITTE